MKLTVFEPDGDVVRANVTTDPPWQPVEEWEGQPVTGVQVFDLLQVPRATLQQARLRAGGHFVMHASPDLVFCQVVHGRGVLGLPDGGRVAFHGPELYVFQPGTRHEWRDVTQDTLLSVCVVHQPADG